MNDDHDPACLHEDTRIGSLMKRFAEEQMAAEGNGYLYAQQWLQARGFEEPEVLAFFNLIWNGGPETTDAKIGMIFQMGYELGYRDGTKELEHE